MDDRLFDSMLENAVGDIPPDAIVTAVTPFRAAMMRVLWGLALSTLTLNFLSLNYILPAIGLLLLLLGFRALRRDNAYFDVCFLLTVIRSVYFYVSLVMHTTIYGRSDLMHASHPAGTFSCWPIGTVAALATIKELKKPGVYERFDEIGEMLCEGFQKLGKKYDLKVFTRHVGAVFVLYFGFTEDVDDLRDWIAHADVDFYQKFVQGMEEYGVRMTSKRGRIYLSTAHTNEDIEKTLDIADQVLGEIVDGKR